jgi:hypothetical protein
LFAPGSISWFDQDIEWRRRVRGETGFECNSFHMAYLEGAGLGADSFKMQPIASHSAGR